MVYSKQEKAAWVSWLKKYGAMNFLESFLKTSHGAESKCVHCGQPIYLDLLEGCGVPDWKTADGDYGCGLSPETSEEGTGSHQPKRLKE